MEKPIVKDVQVRSELEIRLVNIAQRCGRAFRQKWRDPVRVWIAQRIRTERVNVNGDRSRQETKSRLRERTGNISRIPTVIERAIGHGIAVWKYRRRVFKNGGNAVVLKLFNNVGQPIVASL